MKKWRFYLPLTSFLSFILLTSAIYYEFESSTLQARFFAKLAKELSFEIKPQETDKIIFPEVGGPYDIRLGYPKIPAFIKNLERNGYVVDQQSEMSPRMRQLINFGLFPVYHEKTNSGIVVKDRKGEVVYQVVRPQRSFAQFTDIPKIVVDTLLFIENREILDAKYPKKNPAVEWTRLGKALIEKGLQEIYPDRSAPGGSTLATQIEKYRHSKGGRTRKAKDKFKQMFTASFRAYLDGENTTENRKQIVLDYINSIPLAAVPGFGEVNGLGDGLWAWYGVDFIEISNILNHPEDYNDPEKFKIYALAYKQVLSLFLSHRRPSSFLLTEVRVLNGFADDYLDLLAENKIVSEELKNQAQQLDLHLRSTAPKVEPTSFLDNKAANALRTQLLSYFNLSKLYELDQFDLEVKSTIDKKIQDEVTKALVSLKDKETAAKFGLVGEHGLGKGDTSKVLYSVTLYEHVNGKNLLRVQTDNLNKPFNINEGAKLDLGSTAKLRVTTNYLQIIDILHEKYASWEKKDLIAEQKKVTDPISIWAVQYLLNAKDKSLAKMLDAAMERKYSASTGETFFTGGGIHRFNNFKKEDNGKVPAISEALRYSINLPFIRLMRDIVRYYMASIPGSPTNIKDDLNEDARMAYLEKFADKEGSYFLEQFYGKYQKLEREEVLPAFVNSIKKSPKKLSVIYRYVYPDNSFDDFRLFLKTWLVEGQFERIKNVRSLYDSYPADKFSLQDQGYLAKVHPLELWLVKYLIQNPSAKFVDIIDNSKKERIGVYQWLFRKKLKRAQDVRIKVLIEEEAFLEIHKAWKSLGYPFDYLVPSYATAIGSSGDRPMALAELIGIILNNGVQYPNVKIDKLKFGENTPYQTSLFFSPSTGERKLKVEVALRLKEALQDVVENGTARRVNKSFVDSSGKPIAIGGKTGTGDHRFDKFGPGGRLISSRVVNRTATFIFFIGNRFFGVVTAHVHGEEAAKYDFTSSIAAGLLKALSSSLQPLIIQEEQASSE